MRTTPAEDFYFLIVSITVAALIVRLGFEEVFNALGCIFSVWLALREVHEIKRKEVDKRR